MHWTLGVLVGLPIAGFLILACLVAAAIAARLVARDHKQSRYGNHWTDYLIVTPWLIGALVVAGITALCFIPYDTEYHQWRPVEGTVQQIDKRMVKDGSGMSERYAVTINGTVYGVDDTRASTLQEGSHVRLSCIKEWQWAASDGYGCRWND